MNQPQDYLARLIQWRHDPELVEEIREYANKGEVNAQYALGLLYAEGRGIQPDAVQAYLWLSRAYAQGDEDARDLRQIVVEQMTEQEFQLAQRLFENEVLH